jgi:hypothetical protein
MSCSNQCTPYSSSKRNICIAQLMFAAAIMCVSCPAPASWLSDITGVNIDIPGQKLEIGTPNPAAIPQMLQNLPRDAANFFLSPGGPPLAFAIRQAEANAMRSAKRMPDYIRQQLAPFFPPVILDGALWTTSAESGVNVASALEQANGAIGAITANRIIIFRGPSEAQNPIIWAHELVHVTQYRNMGVEGFAAMYAGWGAQQIEGDAYAWQGHVAQSLQANQSPGYGPFSQQWVINGTPRPLTWNDFHAAALQTIPAYQCVQHATLNALAIQVQNICNIGVVVVGVHFGPYAAPCSGPICVFPPNSSHVLTASPGFALTQPVDSIDFQFLQ